jgi:hypothetical protein
MKKLILSIFLLASVFASSQVKFISTNKDDMRALSDSLVSNAKRHYIFKSEKSSEYAFKYEYVNTVDDLDRLYVLFRIIKKGENKDLEIKGVPEYRFESVSGRFLDLFPFWSKFINPGENMEALQAKGVTYIKRDNMTYLISKSGENWSISLNNY